MGGGAKRHVIYERPHLWQILTKSVQQLSYYRHIFLISVLTVVYTLQSGQYNLTRLCAYALNNESAFITDDHYLI